MRLAYFLPLIFLLLFEACTDPSKDSAKTKPAKDLGKELLAQAIGKHGGSLFDSAHYQFEFRGKTYSFFNHYARFVYTKRQHIETDTIVDSLSNEGFSRWINRVPQTLSDSDIIRFSESLNSVIYFATLPHKLTDPAVKSQHLGSQTIKDKVYEMVQVTFSAENGGKDFEDTYLYWINKNENTIDFFAYNYKVNGGGVRFRSAYNRRIIEGVYFQDYINYKAPVGTSLDTLAILFEKNGLEELSRIETEKVICLQ